MEHVAFERSARLLVLLHAGLAMALAGASTHLALASLRLVRRGAALARLVRVHGQTTALLYVAVFCVGLLAYPAYRYHVRGLYLDRYAPWASNLFDMKENLAALALPLAIALFAVTRRLDPRAEPGTPAVVAALAVLVWAAAMFAIASGLWVALVRGV